MVMKEYLTNSEPICLSLAFSPISIPRPPHDRNPPTFSIISIFLASSYHSIHSFAHLFNHKEMIDSNTSTSHKLSKITSSSSLCITISLLLVLLIVQNIPTCLGQQRAELLKWYADCGSHYTCGDDIRSISYPFWGGTRPKKCGHPRLELQCDETTGTTTLQIRTLQYQVRHIDPNDTSLTISRLDLQASDDTCPTTFIDTELDFTILNYAAGYGNITILYGCPPLDGSPYGEGESSSSSGYFNFSCSVRGTNLKDAYAVPSEIATDAFGCNASVVVPINESSKKLLVPATVAKFRLEESIEEGFEVVYQVDNRACIACVATDGRCGYDWSKNVTVCVCPYGSLADSENHTCKVGGVATAGSGSSTHRNIIIGVSVGAAAIAALLCACLVFRQRKKKQLLGASNAAGKSKDITSTTAATAAYTISGGVIGSSNGYTTTPTTNYSQSTSSYVSSRSDIEKGRGGGGGGGLGRDDSSYFGVQLFSYEELEEATSHFDEARELGDGGFGTVYYGKLTDGRLVAVKRLYENSVKRIGQFMNEIEILARLRHKNLVTLYGCTSRRSRELLLVYEYISNGTVADHLHGKLSPHHSSSATKTHHLPWQTRLKIAIETAEALAFLHERDVIHRDVKTTNILLDQHFCVKVADFGLCRLFPTDVTHVSTAPQGTPGYVDPEYYQCYRLTEKSDVFSFGVVLIELISSKQAVDITRHRHHINLSNMALDKIQNHQLDELVDPVLGYREDCSVDKMVTGVAELAFMCLQQERDMRPTMGEVLDALIEIKKSVDGDKLQEVLVVGHNVGGCKEEEEDAELLKNVPPPLSPEESKGGGPRV